MEETIAPVEGRPASCRAASFRAIERVFFMGCRYPKVGLSETTGRELLSPAAFRPAALSVDSGLSVI